MVVIKEFQDTNLNGNYYPGSGKEIRGSILIGCAMGITQKYYINLAEFFAESGYAVLTFDFRGTGISSPRSLRNYSVDLFDWVNDITYALAFLREKNPEAEMIFIGHSISSQLFGFVEKNQFIKKAIFLASSTGYWRDGGSSKWKNLFLLSVAIPFSNFVWGFTNAKFFGQGENYPKGPAIQWRRWCLHPEYLGIELNEGKGFFSRYTGRITAYYFTDDPIANETTSRKLLSFYENATAQLIGKNPKDFEQKRIGHTGFLSRKFKTTFWKEIVEALVN